MEIRKELQCDVLVVGGGVSGIAAAVCAAREGSQVILTDSLFSLGATATLGLVGPFMTCSDPEGKEQLIFGFYQELIERLTAAGGAMMPMQIPCGTSYSGYHVAGHSNCAPFDAEIFKQLAEDICAESGVKIIYGLTLIDTVREGNRILAGIFASRNGIYSIAADQFIDCTGDAALTEIAGFETILPDREKLQGCSLFFEVGGINNEVFEAYCADQLANNPGNAHFEELVREERALGNFNVEERDRFGLYKNPDGTWRVNATRMVHVDATDAEEVTSAILKGRHQVHDIVSLLRRRVPGCEHIYVIHTGSILGVRESRHIVGEYTLTAEDIREGRVFEDAVVRCSNSIDFHGKIAKPYEPTASSYYTIPFRSLIPQGSENLLVAGRCVSADQLALSAIRVMPPCIAMGQAAGVAAAICCKQMTSPHSLGAETLQNSLRKQEVLI